MPNSISRLKNRSSFILTEFTSPPSIIYLHRDIILYFVGKAQHPLLLRQGHRSVDPFAPLLGTAIRAGSKTNVGCRGRHGVLNLIGTYCFVLPVIIIKGHKVNLSIHDEALLF